MDVTTFEIRVRPSGDDWYVYAPAFGVGRFVTDQRDIPREARAMIAACGAAPRVFSVELV